MKDILRAILDLGSDDRESYVPSSQFPYERHAKKRSIVEPEQVIVPDNSQDSVPRSVANH